ncbi:Transcription regulator AsnC-type [Syntrophomonas zehnderi OL-4]|uniref:siroheme decarboxylase n=1 Tax=Syntrophomonas zehnderi OL-4 TaxID=690567 RepID=A0A0E4C9A9_9FIRM|nr:AsnC family transcriptional regulator [Syntrophomonas zehnderi]CFX92323.1 Transcription regulator AsnC-type [Syntrophomonas zehnderi OL-4]
MKNMLDKTDQVMLNILQNSLPLSVQPYKDIAQELGIEEDEVLKRIARLKSEGLIRRIGGIMNSSKLGFSSTLCAMSVPEDRIEATAELINQMTGVTHNYLREHHYNVWFTLTVRSQAEVKKQLKELEEVSGLKVISMPASKVYKINVSFDMEKQNEL